MHRTAAETITITTTSTTTQITSDTFNRLPFRFFRLIAIELHDPNTRRTKSTPLRRCLNTFFCTLTWCNVLFVAFMEKIYFIRAPRQPENFVQLCEVLLCIGYIWMCIFKVATMLWQRHRLNGLIAQLHHMFPGTRAAQHACHTLTYARRTRHIMNACAGLQIVMIALYSFNPFVDAVLGAVGGRGWNMTFALVAWYPFDVWPGGWFELVYVSQTWAAFVAAIGILATDLMVCSCVMQLCMHYDCLRRTLATMRAGCGHDRSVDRVKLRQCVRYHVRILRLSVDAENIFAFGVLVNFVSSVLILCVLGFLMTLSAGTPSLLKYVCSLLTSILQVYLVCYLGDRLNESSTQVGQGAWNGEWLNANLSYQKSLQMICMRSQRPQYLMAYKFSTASMLTFKQLLSTSWSYFVILQSVYEK